MQSKSGNRLWWIAAAVLCADQLSKALALRIAAPVNLWIASLIPSVYNTGAAFSLGSGGGWLLIALTGALAVAIAAYLIFGKNITTAERVGLLLTLGGGLGNLIDRIARPGVVDFISFNHIRFPVFNIGDICVCVGVGIAIIGMLAGARKKT